MWLWQRNKLKYVRMLRILCGTTLAHLCAVGTLFVAYGGPQKCCLTVSNRVLAHQHVVFLPLYKKTPRSAQGQCAGSRVSKTAKKIVPKIHKKSEKPKTALAHVQKTKVPAQKTKKAPAKKVATKITKKSVPLPEPVVDTVALPIAVDAEHDVVYVGQEEHDALMMYEQIQHEVVRCWRPPVGLGAHACCTVAVRIGWQGAIDSCTVTQPSGVLVYDISARSSIKNMVFPRSTYGKEIILTFKQERES